MSQSLLTPTRSSTALPIAILILCCLFWGFSFPAMQISASTFEKALESSSVPIDGMRGELAARSIFNSWRFALATAAFFLFTFPRYRHFSRADVVGGLLVGLTFCLGILLQLIGLRYTLPSTSSFLTALSVIFAPLAQTLLLGRPLGSRTVIAVIVALIGMFILSQPNPHATTSETIAETPPFPHLGEILTIIGSLLFTAQILSIDHFGQLADATRLTFIMLLATCLLSLVIGVSLGGLRFHRAPVFSLLAHDGKFLACFAGLALISSMLSQYLMNRYQPLVAPATAAVVYCLEPVFGTLFSVAFATERLSAITIIGGSIILLAVLLVA
ncbi:MAG TPA: DMT family transporter, partial [Tepidisphaeraceae bacterium]|nr:DMT family transporter [Tepidisphaeraceae bacterium]